MSGVVIGSRLEQLEQLAVKIAQEIAQERRARAIDCRFPRDQVVARVARTEPSDAVALRQLGVTAHDVRVWALAAGLPTPRRGRVPVTLIDAYAEAHPMQRADA